MVVPFGALPCPNDPRQDPYSTYRSPGPCTVRSRASAHFAGSCSTPEAPRRLRPGLQHTPIGGPGVPGRRRSQTVRPKRSLVGLDEPVPVDADLQLPDSSVAKASTRRSALWPNAPAAWSPWSTCSPAVPSARRPDPDRLNPPGLDQTLTWDQGSEMALHKRRSVGNGVPPQPGLGGMARRPPRRWDTA